VNSSGHGSSGGGGSSYYATDNTNVTSSSYQNTEKYDVSIIAGFVMISAYINSILGVPTTVNTTALQLMKNANLAGKKFTIRSTGRSDNQQYTILYYGEVAVSGNNSTYLAIDNGGELTVGNEWQNQLTFLNSGDGDSIVLNIRGENFHSTDTSSWQNSTAMSFAIPVTPTVGVPFIIEVPTSL
jgi:hypothetical protein